jgi:GNAT superfamily N-acetyltransferase
VITQHCLTGADLDAVLDDVAALRITVFRDWPYLYEGSLEYERHYLEPYRNSAKAIVVGAFDGTKLIGAATGTPMTDHASDFAAAFSAVDIPLSTIFYCAESVLLPAYRGQGLGHRFFDAREAHARSLGHSHSAFCSVVRPKTHPLRPLAARDLSGFWSGRGYAPVPGVIAQFEWRDIDQAEATPKPLQFWMRAL